MVTARSGAESNFISIPSFDMMTVSCDRPDSPVSGLSSTAPSAPATAAARRSDAMISKTFLGMFVKCVVIKDIGFLLR